MKKAVRSPKCSQQSMKVVQGLGASNLYGIDYEKGSLWGCEPGVTDRVTDSKSDDDEHELEW